jgi:hypothetical protein
MAPVETPTQSIRRGSDPAERVLANLLQRHSSSQRPKTATQEAIEQLVTSALVSAGLDEGKLDALRKQGQKELREWAAKRKAENDAQRKEIEPAIQQIVGSWRNKLQQFNDYTTPPASPFHYFLLDTASDISPTPKLALTSANIGPTNNWAEFELQATDSSAQWVTFTFEWQNASDVFALINIHGYLVLNGEIEALAGGSFFGGDTSEAQAYVELRASVAGAPELTLVSETLPPVTSVGQGFWEGGQITDQPVFRGFDLEADLQIVPPGGVVTVQILFDMVYTNDDGQVDYVFTGLDRKVLSPGVLIVVVS